VPADCDETEHDVVCDNRGVQYPNLCSLPSQRRQLSYAGHCMTHCEHNGVVCGVNGETYMNECSAYAHRVAVDYHSPCNFNANRFGKLLYSV